MDSHISSSQLTTWLRCPKQYEFRYLQGFKTPPSGALVRGSACHKGVEADYKQKIESKVNLPLEAVLSVYADEYENRTTEVEWKDDEDKGEIKDSGVRMVTAYYEGVATKVQPIASEEPFEIEVFGHIVKGVIDVETVKGEIRDLKTASKKKTNIPMDHQLQMAFYSKAKPKAKSFILDNAIATKKNSEVEILTLSRSDLPMARLEAYLDGFAESLEKGNFPPTSPDNWVCSAKWCGYSSMCPFFSGKKS